jgi:hypothetical protein
MKLDLHLPSGVRWSGTLVAGTLVACIAGYQVLVHGTPLVAALFRPSADPKDVDTISPLLPLNEQAHTTYRKRFEGRSLFFAPADWKRKAPPPPPPPPPAPAPPPPPPPTDYTGPKPIGLLGSVVYFEGGRTIELGKEGDGVTVVEVVTPWQLKLKHKERVYDVPVGSKPNESLFKPLESATTPSGLTPATPSTPKTGGATPGTAPRGAAGNAAGGASPAEAPATGAPAGGPSLQAAPAVPAPPAPLAAGEVARMDAAGVEAAIARIDAALKVPGLDPAVRTRLEGERRALAIRAAELEEPPAPPPEQKPAGNP